MTAKIINAKTETGIVVPIIWDPFRQSFLMQWPTEPWLMECRLKCGYKGNGITLSLDFQLHETSDDTESARSVIRENTYQASFTVKETANGSFTDLLIAEYFLVFFKKIKEDDHFSQLLRVAQAQSGSNM